MNNLSEEDSFAASNIEDEDITPEESIVNHATRIKPVKKQQNTANQAPQKTNEQKLKKSPKQQEKKEEKPV